MWDLMSNCRGSERRARRSRAAPGLIGGVGGAAPVEAHGDPASRAALRQRRSSVSRTAGQPTPIAHPRRRRPQLKAMSFASEN